MFLVNNRMPVAAVSAFLAAPVHAVGRNTCSENNAEKIVITAY